MFSYISDTEIEENIAAATATLFTKMNNNQAGAANGDPGAPRLKIQAMPAPTAGNAVIREWRTGNYSGFAISQSWQKAWSVPIMRTGTYRTRINMWTGGFFILDFEIGTFYAQIRKNGVAFGTLRSLTSASTVQSAAYTEDLSFAAGDTLDLYLRNNEPGMSACEAELKICVANPLRPIARVIW